MQYYIRRDQRVSGPFTSKQVKAAYKADKLHPSDLIGASDDGPWQSLESAILPNPKRSGETAGYDANELASDLSPVQASPFLGDELGAVESGEGDLFSSETSLTVWDDLLPQDTVDTGDQLSNEWASSGSPDSSSSAYEAAKRDVARREQAAEPEVTSVKVAGAICWALGALVVTQIGCFGLLGVWPMTLLTKHYYENGDQLKTLSFGIATVISAILAVVWFVMAYDYISKASGTFWSNIFGLSLPLV